MEDGLSGKRTWATKEFDELLQSASTAEIRHKTTEAREVAVRNIVLSKAEEISKLKRNIIELQTEKASLLKAVSVQSNDIDVLNSTLRRQQSARTDLEHLTKEAEIKLTIMQQENEALKEKYSLLLSETKIRFGQSLQLLKSATAPATAPATDTEQRDEQ
jgi:chromosome segregation ATPase